MRIFKAVFVRLLFVIHIFLCVNRLWERKDKHHAWWLIGVFSALLLIVEAVVTLRSTKHGEWHGFTPCIFIYLLGTVPALGLMEWSLLEQRVENQNNGTCPDYTANAASSLDVPGVVRFVRLDYNFSLALHQLLVILLVAGRWLLPKGKMSREKLSNILLAYVGMAADILEFYAEGIQRDEIRCERIVVRAILCLWAISLVQFPFTLSEDSKAKRRKSLSYTNESLLQRIKNADVWGIVMIVFLQDGPFLGMRLYLIIDYGILDQLLIFFTIKNILVVMLQFYRLWILLCLTWEAGEGKFSWRVVSSIRHKWRGDSNNNHQHDVERANEESDDEDEEENDTFHPQRENSYPQRPPIPTTGPQPQHAHGRSHWKTRMMDFKMNKLGFNRKRDNAQPQSPGATTMPAAQYVPGEPRAGQHHIQANGHGPSRDRSQIQQPPNASTSPPSPAFPDQNTRGYGEPYPVHEQPAFVFTDPNNPASPPQQQQQQPAFVFNDPNRTASAGTSRNPYPAELGHSFDYQPHQRDPGNFQSSRDDLRSDVPHGRPHEANPDHLGWPGYRVQNISSQGLRQHYQRERRTEYAYRPYDQESSRYNSPRTYRSPYSVGQRGGDVYYGRR